MDNRKVEKKSKKMGLVSKLVLRIAVALCFFAVLFFGAKIGWTKFTQVKIEKRRAMVERELLESAELVLYKMRYSDVISIKKKKAISSAYSLVRYTGIIRAGIEDISLCEISVSEDGKNLSVKIPHAVLLGNEIHNQDVFDESQGVIAKITTQEVFEEIEAAKQQTAQEIVEEGLLAEADARAVLVIKQLLSPIGFENVLVELK